MKSVLSLIFVFCTCMTLMAAHRQYDIYLVGSNTGWSFWGDHKMNYLGDGVYYLDCSGLTFNAEFKIATSDWRTIDLGGASLVADHAVPLVWKGSNIPYPSGWNIGSLTVMLAEDLSSYTLLCTSVPRYSGTLPILHINTESGRGVTSTDEYVAATCWQESSGIEGCEDIGSADSALVLSIRGRGNWTWNGFDKKPYRIKLDKKASLGGLRKAKNFCLMARADDNLGYLRDEVGYEVSRRLGMPWTPDCRPIELILNGDYLGLYFITEPVRIGQHHVDITEQEDGETDPDSITGGWLMEIDNYAGSDQIQMKAGNGDQLYLTYHSPEVLSAQQRAWLTEQMKQLDKLIYSSDKTSTVWERYIDKDALVRFYLVNEIMEDTESFHGSCYFYRDRGDTCRWTWGPVWDFGNAYRVMKDRFIYDRPQFTQYWIGEMVKWESFQFHLRQVWQEWLSTGWPGLTEWVAARADTLAEAARYDAARWPSYGANPLSNRVSEMQYNLEWRMRWLIQQWGELSDVDEMPIQSSDDEQPVYDLMGRPVQSLSTNGLYIRAGRRIFVR